MLRWRLLLGTLIIAALIGLCWLDATAAVPGMYLMPVVVILAIMATREILDFAAAAGHCPPRLPVYIGNVFLASCSWLAAFDSRFPAVVREYIVPLVFVAAAMLVLAAEMRRYRGPGGHFANIASGVFALAYVGLMLCFAVQLRLFWGIGAVAVWIIVVKMGDSGAYFTGRLFGRHKLAPSISPGKTIEGAVGATVFACLGSWLAMRYLVPASGFGLKFFPGPWWGWLVFGLLVGTAGMLGDLAESLLKRDVGRKDSSDWMPGFGGVLDILDSLLLSAPVAWFCWASGMLGGV